jgi:hypothetical protein
MNKSAAERPERAKWPRPVAVPEKPDKNSFQYLLFRGPVIPVTLTKLPVLIFDLSDEIL